MPSLSAGPPKKVSTMPAPRAGPKKKKCQQNAVDRPEHKTR